MVNSINTKDKKYEDLPTGLFYDLTLNKNSALIDVRSAGEFEGGKIRGAINMDVSSSHFLDQLENLPKDKTYLVYCRSGNRSGKACEIMNDLGFKNVKNLQKGLLAWPFGTE